MNKNILLIVSLIVIISLANSVYAQNETNFTENSTDTIIVCGNNNCEFNETYSCPSDCDNCTSDLDCNEGDLCTIDKCGGTPKICTYAPKDCEDNNPATIDGCNMGECQHTPTTACKSGDNYCPTGCNAQIDTDCPQLEKDNCNSNKDCEDNNPCSTDLCEGNPKGCNHVPKNGCSFGNQCVDYGSRETMGDIPQYCNKFGKWDNQKLINSLCDENYECVTNTCSQGKCIEPAKEPTIFEKIFDWILRILGFVK